MKLNTPNQSRVKALVFIAEPRSLEQYGGLEKKFVKRHIYKLISPGHLTCHLAHMPAIKKKHRNLQSFNPMLLRTIKTFMETVL